MTDLYAVAEDAAAKGYQLTPLGQLVLDLGRTQLLSADGAPPARQQQAKIRPAAQPADVAVRLATNRARLARAERRLAALTGTPDDPAVVNLPVTKRLGAITEARLDRWRLLTAQVARLRRLVALDEQRLETGRGVPGSVVRHD